MSLARDFPRTRLTVVLPPALAAVFVVIFFVGGTLLTTIGIVPWIGLIALGYRARDEIARHAAEFMPSTLRDRDRRVLGNLLLVGVCALIILFVVLARTRIGG
jgi:hypothetical protein